MAVNADVSTCNIFRAPARLSPFSRTTSCILTLLLAGAAVSSAQTTSGSAAPSTPSSAAPVPLPTQSISPTTLPQDQATPQTQNRNQAQDQTRTSQEETTRRTNEEAQRRESLGGTAQEPLTAFQRLADESTGATLPIFGADLFNNVPSTFAPVDNIPVSNDYVVGPGDELRIQLYGQVNSQGNYTVDRNGDISVPTIGTIHVAGLHYGQLEDFLRTQMARVYRNFSLTVNLGQLRSMQIFVLGQVRHPGAFTVSSLSTLVNALLTSGGPVPQGSLRDVQLQRGGQTVVHLDLYDLLLRGDKTHDVPLAPGDVIFVPVVGAQAAIAGSVQNPAIYEIRPGTKVSDLIQLSGGRTSVAVGNQVRLERIFEHTMRSIVDIPLSPEHDPLLADGDILSIGAIMNKYNNAVVLRGNVTAPGRYVWHQGMRITDLVPTREQLITRDYYRRLNSLGNAAPDATGALQVRGNTNTANEDAVVSSGANNASTRGGSSLSEALTASNNVFPAATDVILSAPDLDWSYAVIERLNHETLTTSLISFAPGNLYLKGDQSQNLELLPGDVVTFFSTADLKVPSSQQTRFVRLEGEFGASGVYSVAPGETLRSLLRRAGSLTPGAYLYGSQFTRLSTRRIQQQRLNEYADNLDAQLSIVSSTGNARATSALDSAANQSAVADARSAIARLRALVPIGRIVLDLKPNSASIDDVPDIELEDGDRFVVPRTPATVAVEGQVYNSNAFLFERDRREIDYLHKAGGPDRQADKKRTFILRADGSVFSSQYGNVAHAPIFPGDTVVVPPKFSQSAFLRNLLDASTIIGQFGLGAAAIEVFK